MYEQFEQQGECWYLAGPPKVGYLVKVYALNKTLIILSWKNRNWTYFSLILSLEWPKVLSQLFFTAI
jgi:hypothetical protein